MELVHVLAKLIGISMVVAAVSCSSAVPFEVEPTRIADLTVRPEATSKPTDAPLESTSTPVTTPKETPPTIMQIPIKPTPDNASASISLFDAHNHMPKGLTAEKIISVMDQENIAKVILMGKGPKWPSKVTSRDDRTLRAYQLFPDRIVPFIGLNGYKVEDLTPQFFDYLDRQFEDGKFVGIGELLSRHYSFSKESHGETVEAGNYDLPMDHPVVHDLMCLASKHDVVLVVHMESEDETILALERALAANPDTKVIWAHQTHPKTFGGSTEEHSHKAKPRDIARLLEEYPNLYADIAMGQESFHMTKGDRKIPGGWKNLYESHSDRFTIGYDMPFLVNWNSEKAIKGRSTIIHEWLSQLKPETQKKFAVANIERILRDKPPKTTECSFLTRD